MMKATYSLTGDTLPILPTPHDCKIKKFKLTDDEFRIVIDDIEHDAVKYAFPGAKKKIRIRFFNDFNQISRGIEFYRIYWKKDECRLKPLPDFHTKYRKNSEELIEYSYGTFQVIVHTTNCIISIETTRVEFEWE